MLDEGCKSEEDTSDRKLKPRGRNRFCKQCKFSCTDPKDFLNHQKYAHSQDKDPDILHSISKRRKSSNSNLHSHVKKVSQRSTSIHSIEKKLPVESETVELKCSNDILEQKQNNKETIESKLSDKSDSMDSEEQALLDVKLPSAETRERSRTDNTEKVELDRREEKMDHSELEQNAHPGSEHDEQDDEGKLVIAEDEQTSNRTPTRSGNIQNRTYVCNLCEFSSTSAKTFLHHQKDEHNSDIIIYECDICEYATKYKQKLPRHRKLHFTGKENNLLSNFDLEGSFDGKERSGSFSDVMKMGESIGQNFIPHVVDEEDDDDDDEEEEEGLPLNESQELAATPNGTPTVEKKKRKTRQEVDPGKYFEVLDETGVKYACSKCGNVYKWRKSLNKHWKEKHFGDIPDSSHPPAGLAKLNSLTHVQFRFPTKGGERMSPSSQSHKGERSRSETPVSMVDRYPSSTDIIASESTSMSSVVMPRFIGPFITDSLPNARPHGSNPKDSPTKSEEFLSRTQLDSSREQPIDFSVKKENDFNIYQRGMEIPFTIKSEWTDPTLPHDFSGGKKDESPILQCNRCSFVAKTLVDYSSHMTLHLNKRAFKCAECQEHFNNVEDLNKHFGENHSEKIHEHKEAIQKIPHGLQQTYHLLKMPLNSIGSVAVSEASSSGTGEPKYLKCSMCNFVAKWPAELQKHAVSHSEERPFVCMVCGSTYKWKWDLVKHFEKSHNSLTNPYKRREQGSSPAPSMSKSEQLSPSLKSPPILSPVTGSYGYRSSLYPMTSTASALIDSDAFHKRSLESYSHDEPLRKKRRLSDTDMPILMSQSESNHDGYITAGAVDNDMAFDDSALYKMNDDRSEDSESSLKMSGSSALRDMENLIPPEDEKGNDPNDMFGTCSINPQTQMAVINAVKKRMEGGKMDASSKIRATEKDKNSDILLPYKCQMCEYRARWPSEITQHMKNHSDEKPYHCPRCSYKSKWKWDVVKHLKRCGGGTIKDVIDTNKLKKHSAPPNVTVMPRGTFHHSLSMTQSNYLQSQGGKNIEGRYAISSVAEALASNNSAIMAMAEMNKSGYESSLSQEYEKEILSQFNKEGLEKMGQSRQPVFRSIVNQGVYHCFECPFIAQSPAELRRHGVLHSENKPFNCTVCGYSSRWKCDLKKHIRTYGHYDQTIPGSTSQNVYTSDKFRYQVSPREIYPEEDQQEPEERTLFKCNKCPYSTFKKFSFDTHMKLHGEGKKEELTGKYNCKQCDFQGSDLISFLQHKKTHAGKPAETSGPEMNHENSGEQVSNRTLQKHRRKPVQQFRCSKCPYTCFKRSGLTMHEAMHIPRGNDALKCYYCSYNVFSKGLLVQHMRLHPEFDPNECGDYAEILENNDFESMDTEEYEYYNAMKEEDMTKYNKMMVDEDSHQSLTRNDFGGSSSSVNTNNAESALDLSSSSFTSLSDEPRNKLQNNSFYGQSENKDSSLQFPCEWCPARFHNLVKLYQHASARHPLELRAQEMGETPSMTLPTRMNDPYLERQKRLQQKQELQKQHELEQQKLLDHQQKQQMYLEQHHMQQSLLKNALNQPRYRAIEPKPSNSSNEHSLPSPVYSSPPTPSQVSNSAPKLSQDPNNNKSTSIPISQSSALVAQALLAKAKKSTSPNKRGRSFQCTKCSFTAPNAVTYLRHIERHGSNCRHTCQFCDYSIDRLNLLYQHMKGTHSDLWRGTPEEKISLTSGSNKNSHNYEDMRSKTPSTSEMSSENLNKSFDGSFTGSYTEEWENRDDYMNPAMSEMKLYHSMALKGQKPILIIKEETTWYGLPIQVCTINGRKCYKCPKCIYVNSNATILVNHVRHHGNNKKFTCELCDFSVESRKVAMQHSESVHPKDPIFIERSPSKIPFVPEGNNSVEENNNSLIWSNQSLKACNLILPTCTKCPFKCRTVEMLQYHLTLHNLDREFKCNYCEFSVDSQILLLKHLAVHREPYEPDLRQNEEEEIKTANDGQSQDQFLSKIDLVPSSLSKEMKSNENKLTPQHIKNVLSSLKNSCGRLRYKCSRCPYFSFCKNNISKHRKQHIIKSRFKCHLCDYSATRAFLRQQHMKFHENSSNMDTKCSDYQDIILDPFDEDGLQVLKNMATPEVHLTNGDDNIKDFSDENTEYGEENSEATSLDDENEEFDEQKMAALEQAEFEGLDEKKTNEVEIEGQESDDSLSEMDPSTLQQQMSLNLSGIIGNGEKIRYTCSQCPYKCNALRSFKCHIHMHGLNKKYICDYCNWSADRLNLLYQHRKVHVQQPSFNANPEDIVFLNRNYALENDGQGSTTPEDLSGYKQNKPSLSDDEKSLQRMSDRNFSGKKIYACKECPFSCNNKNSFAYHKSLHRINARYTCNECTYSVDRWNLLSQHMKLHKSEFYGHIARNNIDSNVSSPEVEPQLYFTTGESPNDSEMESEEEKLQDLKCNRCPYSTLSKDQLHDHYDQHAKHLKHNCPYCDYSDHEEKLIIEHVQLHFPSTKLDQDAVKAMLAKQGEKIIQNPEVPVVKSSKKDFVRKLEPDSTVENKGESPVTDDVPKSKTKVYVCQYCEREFEGKSLMLQHERQHLIGSKF